MEFMRENSQNGETKKRLAILDKIEYNVGS